MNACRDVSHVRDPTPTDHSTSPPTPTPDPTYYPLTTHLLPTNSDHATVRVSMILSPRTYQMFLKASRAWGDRHVPTSGIRHRPRINDPFLAHLLSREGGAYLHPRADSRAFTRRAQERKVRIARSVAPWTAEFHLWNRATHRADLSGYRQALQLTYRKEGEGQLRAIGREGLLMGVVSPVEDGRLIPPESVTEAEMHKLTYAKPGDAFRLQLASHEEEP